MATLGSGSIRLAFGKLRRASCGEYDDHLPHLFMFKRFPEAIGERCFCPGDITRVGN